MKSAPSLLLLIPLLLLTCAQARSFPPEPPTAGAAGTAAAEYLLRDLPGVPDDLRQAVLAGETKKALALVRQLADHDASGRSFWLLIEAAVLQQSGAHAEALSLLARAEEIAAAAQSPWLHKLRFARAASFRALGQWPEAEALLEAEVDRLRSAGRQSDLAGVVIEFADASSTPRADAPPGAPATDYAKAMSLYAQVLAMDVPPDLAEYAQWRIGHCMAQSGDWGGASAAWDAWLRKWDPSFVPAAERGLRPAGQPVPARLFEVRFQHARALGNSGDRRGAERAFQDLEALTQAYLAGTGLLAQSLPRPDETRSAWLQELRGECLYLAGHAAGLAGRQSQRIGALRRFLAAFPQHPRMAEAAFGIGEAELAGGRHAEAIQAWQSYLERPAASSDNVAGVGLTGTEAVETDATLRMRAHFLIAESWFALARYDEAGRAYERYTALFPTGADWAQAQEGVVRAAYEVGGDLMRGRQWAAARAAWGRFLEQHPLHASARATFFAIGELFLFEAEGLEAAAARPLWQQAVAHWGDLASRWPGSEEASHALFASGELLEDRLGELDAAIAAYRRCNFGAWHGHARARLSRMLEEDLALVTPRAWRSGEKTLLQLDLRNLEELEIEIYPLDLEAYFRKHQTHEGVADLDLDLIAPAQKFTWKVPGYRRHAPLARELELPVEGYGAWAVAVSGKNLRATTLVLRSDLDLLVKSSREELLVFAEDMKNQKAAAGVKLVAALPGAAPDGGSRVFELTTGKDGVARLDWQAEGLAATDDLRVYASSKWGAASTSLHLGGLAASQGLGVRGHVAVDRPAYRPGETVAWRAVLRGVADDRWNFRAGEKWRVSILDALGRPLSAETMELTSFGTLAGSFELGAAAPLGEYAIRCSAPDGTAHAGSFHVMQFELPKARLELSLDRGVAFRGETVTGTARASTWFGEPLAAAALQVFLPDGRRLDLRTDAEGAAQFLFDTRETEDAGSLGFLARLAEQGVDAGAGCWLAATGFRAEIRTRRAVVLAGESFPVELRALGWDDKGLAAALKLTVVRRERIAGLSGSTLTVADVWSERVVLEREANTAADTGLATLNVSLDEGGDYRLRVLGVDRFDNPVSAELALTVSGDEDATRLRFLTEISAVQVGAETELTLHNRAGPGLALVTFSGAGVLEYRVLNLQEGANVLRFTAGPEFWPNFSVAADALRAQQLHSAQLSLSATRALQVTLTPSREQWRPGEEAEVLIEARDHLGRPVQAELAIGVVDEALLALWPDPAQGLSEYFLAGSWRQAEMRTAATTLFRYVGTTRYVAQEILDEELAREASRVWEERKQEVQTQLGFIANDGIYDAADLRLGAPAGAPAPGELIQQLDLAQSGEGAYFYGGGGGRGGKARGFGGRSAARDKSGIGQDSVEALPGEALAFWDPRVSTDAQGRATVRFLVPQRSTSWRLQAQGVGPDTLLGGAVRSVVARADFLVELRSPAFLREGDAPTFGARLHNLTGQEGAAAVTLELTAGGRTWSLPAEARFAAGARSLDVEFATPADLVLPPQGSAEIVVRAEGRFGDQALQASARKTVPVQPWGSLIRVARSGLVSADESFVLELPAGQDWRGAALEFRLGHGLDDLLLLEALGGGGGVAPLARPIVGDLASSLIGACAGLEYLERTRQAAGPEYRRLRDRAADLTISLVSAQAQDGSWPWCTGYGQPSGESTARALWALTAASARGLHVAPAALEGGKSVVLEALRRTPSHAHEETALYQHALTLAQASDFGVANRLHRARNEMGVAALAYTTLALAAQNSLPMAAEAAALLAERHQPGQGWSDDQAHGWHRNRVELTALALLALQAAAPRHEAVRSGMDELLRMRPWPAGSASGLATAALAAWRGATEPGDDALQAEVRVGDDVRTLRLTRGSAAETLRFELPGGSAVQAAVRITVRGRGQPHYSAVLSGFTPALVPGSDRTLRISAQKLLAAPPLLDGREIQTGFSVLERVDEHWENEVSQIGMGGMLLGRVDWWEGRRNGDEDRENTYLILEVPLPAGARLVPGSVQGAMEGWEERDGQLIVYLGRTWTGSSVSYRLVGALPGAWRVPPAVLTSAYDPSRRATGAEGKLTVLPRGAVGDDSYRPTPDELFHLGSALTAAGRLEEGAELLQALVDGYERRLEESTLRATAAMLLYAGIAQNEPQRIVRWFEVLKEKSPDLTISFDHVVVVGRAYRALGEHERAALVFQAVLEETFGKDLRVAGILEQQGDLPASADAMHRLWMEYPDLPVVVESALTLADQLLLRAPNAHLDPAFARAGWDRASLIGASVRLLRAFQSLYPQDPLAADAGLDLVSAHLDLEDYEDAAARAREMAQRFPDPHWADTFAYTEAVAAWYLGRDAEARELLTRVAEALYVDEGGAERRSENRDLALYILGQIHHARQEFGDAAKYYERVSEVFADAREALADFRERRLSLEEVTTFEPGEKVKLTVQHRNLGEAEVLVYPVDLMTLYLRERNLSGITGVNLSGIEPTLRRTVQLKGGDSLRPQETSLELDLDDAGAYLVMLRGGELHASGLVLLSEVEIEVREDAVQGRLRIQASARDGGAYLRDVDVRVIGSHNDRFSAGRTDPRGIYVADGVAGSSTVIARWKEDHYAFFRGTQALGLSDQERLREFEPALEQLEAEDYLSNVIQLNASKQQLRAGKLRGELERDRSGVQVQQVK